MKCNNICRTVTRNAQKVAKTPPSTFMGIFLAFFDFYLKFLVYIGKNTKGQTNSLKIEKNMDISFLRGKIMNFADFLNFFIYNSHFFNFKSL